MQEQAFKNKTSTKHWPDSNHNVSPSNAVDICPWPIDWNNRDRFIFLAGVMFTIAKQLDIKIRWGGNWSMSWQFEKQKFNDLAHFELVL
jgi:peptidoglycan L-alanyl-D-glutamate endopeptidase CwlK